MACPSLSCANDDMPLNKEWQLLLTGKTSFLSPDVSPSDRWCSGRRGRGPAARSAMLSPGTARPSSAPSFRACTTSGLHWPGRPHTFRGSQESGAGPWADGRTGARANGRQGAGRGAGPPQAALAPLFRAQHGLQSESTRLTVPRPRTLGWWRSRGPQNDRAE